MQPQLVLGGRRGVGDTQALPAISEVRERAFRFVLATSEVVVVAATQAEREHWLLALRALPVGPLLRGRLDIEGGA